MTEALKTSPANTWKLTLATEYPKLKDLGVRLLEVGTQSADVERVCKAHKVVHTKVRNRLLNKNVKTLLYCYVSLRLLNRYYNQGKAQPDLGEEFLGQALLENLGLDEEEAPPAENSTANS